MFRVSVPFLPPLQGWAGIHASFPQLTLWAVFFRRCAPGIKASNATSVICVWAGSGCYTIRGGSVFGLRIVEVPWKSSVASALSLP